MLTIISFSQCFFGGVYALRTFFSSSFYIDSYLELFRAETMNESSVCIRDPSPKYDRGFECPKLNFGQNIQSSGQIHDIATDR